MSKHMSATQAPHMMFELWHQVQLLEQFHDDCVPKAKPCAGLVLPSKGFEQAIIAAPACNGPELAWAVTHLKHNACRQESRQTLPVSAPGYLALRGEAAQAAHASNSDARALPIQCCAWQLASVSQLRNRREQGTQSQLKCTGLLSGGISHFLEGLQPAFSGVQVP